MKGERTESRRKELLAAIDDFLKKSKEIMKKGDLDEVQVCALVKVLENMQGLRKSLENRDNKNMSRFVTEVLKFINNYFSSWD